MLPEAIQHIRNELAKSGWVIDPTTEQGDRYGHPLGFVGDGFNIMASYCWPHTPSLLGPGAKGYSAKASKCKGGPYGGLRLDHVSITDFNGPNKHLDPMVWATKVVKQFKQLAG